MQNAGLNEAQAGIKVAGRNINNLRYADDTTLMAESEELKNLLMKMKSLMLKFNGEIYQIGKGVRQGCILLPCLFSLYAEYIMRNAGREEAQAGIKIAGRNINNLPPISRRHHPNGRKQRGTKKLLDEGERGE